MKERDPRASGWDERELDKFIRRLLFGAIGATALIAAVVIGVAINS